ncbi:hypothetical protein EDWATA_03606 [Edwardsiella tarda ATCC 23685]|uniref:Uncharacterized protein n=1 Tax=Edwardsiella tarda ATCC 23685 TaxID=500638 RepID=D4F9Z1_EDWTA|nr:hypothetical protein EDWATA_03606 [Edwardsiella tarda ATCC 23685]
MFGYKGREKLLRDVGACLSDGVATSALYLGGNHGVIFTE